MNWIENLLNKYSIVDECLLSKIEGASNKEVDQFEKLANNVLPSDYKEFLLFCGKKDAEILSKIPAFMDIDSLIENYENLLEEDPDDMPEKGWIIIGAGHTGVDLITNNISGAIHYSSYGDVDGYFSDSFSKLFSQEAFKHYRIRNNENQIQIVGSVQSVKSKFGAIDINSMRSIVFSVIQKYQLKQLDLSDKMRVFASGNDIYLAGCVYPEGNFWLNLSSENNEQLLNKISNDIGDALGAFRVERGR